MRTVCWATIAKIDYMSLSGVWKKTTFRYMYRWWVSQVKIRELSLRLLGHGIHRIATIQEIFLVAWLDKSERAQVRSPRGPHEKTALRSQRSWFCYARALRSHFSGHWSGRNYILCEPRRASKQYSYAKPAVRWVCVTPRIFRPQKFS